MLRAYKSAASHVSVRPSLLALIVSKQAARRGGMIAAVRHGTHPHPLGWLESARRPQNYDCRQRRRRSFQLSCSSFAAVSCHAAAAWRETTLMRL